MPFGNILLQRLQSVDDPLKDILIEMVSEIDRREVETLTIESIKDLKKSIADLDASGKNYQQGLERLTQITHTLAELQLKTDQRIAQLADAQQRTEQRLEQLADAQQRTEQRLERLEVTVQQLADAQQRTEQRLERLEVTVQQLADVQQRTEQRLERLEVTVQQLADAQQRTEQRLEQLAEAQQRTEQRVERLEVGFQELISAQKEMIQSIIALTKRQEKTEEALQTLIKDHSETRRQVGGLSNTVGYILEDRAYKAIPELLLKEFGITLTGPLVRKHVQDKFGRYIELNAFVEGELQGEKVVIVGESKAQLSKKKIDEFLRKKVLFMKGVYEQQLFPILITYMTTEHDVEDYAREKGIKRIFFSYEF